MKLLQVASFVLASCLFSHAVFAEGGSGHTSGGTKTGGDGCESEYKGLIPDAAEWLRQHTSETHFTRINKFIKKMRRTKVMCVEDTLSIKGYPKTAVYYQKQNLTKLNFYRWNNSHRLMKRALVVHEGLVLLRVEKTGDYHISDLIWKLKDGPVKKMLFQNEHNKIELIQNGVFPDSYLAGTNLSSLKYNLQITWFDDDGKELPTQLITDSLACKTSELDSMLISCFVVSKLPHLSPSVFENDTDPNAIELLDLAGVGITPVVTTSFEQDVSSNEMLIGLSISSHLLVGRTQNISYRYSYRGMSGSFCTMEN